MDSVSTYDKPVNGPLDRDELLARCLGRIDLVERILQRFHNALDEDVKRLEEAVRGERADEVALVAHRIKGASLAVSAHALTACARSLEECASEGRWDDIPVQVERLKSEGSRCRDPRFLPLAGNLSG
jgi:HPt (histidine-containing phosphotransfer) domain-containing protein